MQRLAPVLLGLVAALVVVGAGGCRVVDDGSDVPAAKERVLDEGRVTWDLREPPTREQLGLPDGDDSLIYEYDDDRTIRADFQLPAGQSFQLDARWVAVSAILSGPPSIDLRFSASSFEEARAQLHESVQQFGLRPAAVQDWESDVAAAERANAFERVETRWLDARLEGLTLAVQGTYFPEEEMASLTYQLSWRRAGDADG